VVETFSGDRYCLEELTMSVSYRVVGLCLILGCSERYLYSVFMRDIGLPPKTWMDLERMVVARRMLEGGKPIEKVAWDLGFMSVEAFRRKFHKVYTVSPARFLRGRRVFDPSNPLPGTRQEHS
jgi:AraC-like DNA-binding protein